MNHFGDQLGQALARSPQFRRDVERWRADADRQRRATKRFSEFESVEAMRAEVDRAYATPGDERPFSHDVVGEWPLARLEDHARQLERGAYFYLGATSYADELRRFVLGEAPGIPIVGGLASLPALTGAGASSIYDRLVDCPTRSRRTVDQAWRRFVDGNLAVEVSEPFYYCKSIDGGD